MCVWARQIANDVLNFLKTREGQIRVASGGVYVPCGGSLSVLAQEERDHVCKLVFVDCQGIIAVLHQYGSFCSILSSSY